MASSQGDLDLVCLLLEHEAEVDAEEVDGKSLIRLRWVEGTTRSFSYGCRMVLKAGLEAWHRILAAAGS